MNADGVVNEDQRIYRGGARALRALALAGIVGLALLVLGAFVAPRQAAFSYLMAYAFTLSIVLGALLFLMIQHAIAASWAVVLFRPIEAIAATLPLLTLLFVPVLFGWYQFFPWLREVAAPSAAESAGARQQYLALTFGALRAAVYFGVWNAVAYLLRRWSIRQQTAGDAAALAHRQRVLSAVGMPAVAFTLTFAAFDWLMSLTPDWYSTIFGVYYFAGGMIAVLSLLAGVALWLERQGCLAGVLTVSHYHALGKLLFAFILFWAYVALAQVLLIWIANVPQEAIWFVTRSTGSWAAVSALIVVGHFILPFFALLSRQLKRRPVALATVGAWMLIMHFIDIYWIVMPVVHPYGVRPNWLDAVAVVGIVGIAASFALWRFRGEPAVATGNPRYRRSLTFFTT